VKDNVVDQFRVESRQCRDRPSINILQHVVSPLGPATS
jgi:hypothetical protein